MTGKGKLPFISIVTVVLNGRYQLPGTLDSICEQSYTNRETIVIDGGSTDGTLAVIRRYDKAITRWVSEPDRGIYDGMNKALPLCRGDYIYFLNCADRFTGPDVLEKVAKRLAEESPDILCGNVLELHGEGTRLVTSVPMGSDYELHRETICHQALFTARHLFDRVGHFDTGYRICADRDWLVRALKLHGYRLSHTDLPICIFDNTGISSKRRLRLRMENMKISRRHFGSGFYSLLLRQAAEKIRRCLCLQTGGC